MTKSRTNTFRLTVLAAAGLAALGLLLFLFLVFELDRLNEQQLAAHRKDLRLQELHGEVLRLDETLTMSARMFAATENDLWLERYGRYEALLDDAFSELAALVADDPLALADTELTMRANEHLLGMEREAFELTAGGRGRVALDMLTGVEYNSMKTVFTEGMQRMVDRVRQQLLERYERRRARALVESAAAAFLIVLLLGAAWLAYLRYRGQVRRRATAERRRGETRALLQSLIDATPDLMFFKDVHGVYLGCNAAFTEFIGRSAEEITGSTDEQIFDDPGVAAFFREQDRIMLEARASRRNEEWVEYPDGSGRLLETLKSPYYSADGRVLGLIGVSRDITEQHRARRELEAAKERAEAANQAKSNFLNNMGHELRTPLIPIVSMVDLLLEGDPGDREREYLELVRDSSQRLLSLINDLLEYSRLEKAEGGVDIQPLEPGRLLEAVRREIEPEAERKGLAVGVEVADGVPSAVMGDQAKIRKALSILAGNAVKFTDNGRVDLVARNGELDARPALVFEVRDTGIGLAPERAETLFQESFTQADDSLSRRYGGVGLGLSMAGRLAEIMDAELDVAGKEGRGSTFRLTVPLDSEG